MSFEGLFFLRSKKTVLLDKLLPRMLAFHAPPWLRQCSFSRVLKTSKTHRFPRALHHRGAIAGLEEWGTGGLVKNFQPILHLDKNKNSTLAVWGQLRVGLNGDLWAETSTLPNSYGTTEELGFKVCSSVAAIAAFRLP